MKFLILLTVIAVSLLSFTGCETAKNTNVNVNVRNSNAILVASPTASPFNRNNPNVNRPDYDKNRAEYEKDRGSSSIGQGANDSWIWFKTKTALATASDLRDSTINVDVANDVITLKGTVATAAQKATAEKVAKEIEGQKGVKNELKIAPNDTMTNRMVNSASDDAKQKD